VKELAHQYLLAALLACLAICGAQAQSFPTKTVRIVIGVPPGGNIDTLARGVAGELSKSWNQPVVVENRVGAGDIIAANTVAKSAPDGYTLFLTSSATFLANQFMRSKLPYDPVKDFVPVVGLTRTSTVLLVKLKLGVSSVQELVALAKSKPGALNYGSFGMGSAPHLDAIAFAAAAGIQITHIPYKGAADVMTALLGGQIDFSFTGLTSSIGPVKQGAVKALAFGGPQRSPVLPQVPTLKEQGYTFEASSWFGIFAPGATPRPIIEKISADTSRVIATPAFRDKYVLGVGMEELNLQAGPFAELLRDSREHFSSRYGPLNIRLD
jgi:tripartite-type tricarboxylate transporter receptor subunit TctC